MIARVAYLCDREACERCSAECRHTEDISHAVNFKHLTCNFNSGCKDEYYWEQESEEKTSKKIF